MCQCAPRINQYDQNHRTNHLCLVHDNLITLKTKADTGCLECNNGRWHSMIVKDEDRDRIVLADSVVKNVFIGLILIAFGLFALLFGTHFFVELHGGLLNIISFLFFGLLAILFGGFCLFWGLHKVLVKESIIIDKRFRSVVIIKESFIKYLESIKVVPFPGIREIEITYNTHCKKCDYDSPPTSNDSWDVSLIATDGYSVQIYQSSYKSKAEKIAEKICKITDAQATHRTHYTYPDFPCP